MAGFDDIFKSAQWHQSIQKSLGLNSQLSEMFKMFKMLAFCASRTLNKEDL
jgi:hypothetical protein